MSYVYVLPTNGYVKFGITADPMTRLDQHQREIGESLSYKKVWKCDKRIYRRIETVVRNVLADRPKKSPERICVHENTVIEAIEAAAKLCGAELEKVDWKAITADRFDLLPRISREQLVAQRKRLGMTQSKLAKALGVDRITIARWETGARSLPPFLSLAMFGLEELMRSRGYC